MIPARWIGATIIVLLIALILNIYLLAYAVLAVLILIGVSKWVTSRWTTVLVAERTCSHTTANVGDRVSVEVTIRNQGRWGISWLLVEDLMPKSATRGRRPALKISGDQIKVVKLGPGKTFQLKFEIDCARRGYYQIGPLVVETGDMFGLNRRFRVLSEPIYLLVYPKTVALASYDIASRRPVGEVVMTHRLFEDPTRIAGIRRYQRGDAMRRIHWKATARSGILQSKVYEPSSMAGATVLIDFHDNAYEQEAVLQRDCAITCAASICKALHDWNQQVGLISNGRDAVDRIQKEGWQGDARTREEARQSAIMKQDNDRLEPVIVETSKVPDQFMRILSALARLEKTDGLTLTDLIGQTMSRIPRDASVIVIISKVTLEKAVALGSLKQQGFAVTAIVNSSDEEHFLKASGILLNHGIESRHLKSEQSITSICERQLIGV